MVSDLEHVSTPQRKDINETPQPKTTASTINKQWMKKSKHRKQVTSQEDKLFSPRHPEMK